MGINNQELIAPVSDEAPCGGDPVTDIGLFSKYSEIEKIAAGTPEQVMGDSVIAAIEPNWGEVCSLSTEFLKVCKDMRVAVLLTRGLLHREGISGLAQGLDLCSQLLQTYWDDLYPKLVDEDGDPEPEIRINAVSDLASDMFIQDLHVTIMVSSRATGAFSYRDYRISRGDLKALEGQRVAEMAHIAGAFMESEAEELLNTRSAIDDSLSRIHDINGCFAERLAEASPPDLSRLAQELTRIAGVFDEFMAQRGMGVASGENPEQDAASERAAGAVAAMASGEVRCREDVIRQIDSICRYYQTQEPSSPVPLVLNRARKLVMMDFMEILKDLCPDGVANVKQLAGVSESDE